MCTISRNKFKRHYLKNKKLSADFLLHFWKEHQLASEDHAVFYCISEHFEKKDEYPSLNISEIMDCERGGYLNV